MKLRNNIALRSAIAIALYASVSVALAQDTAEDEDYEAVLEEVVVQGIRGSLQRSLDTKRDADSRVDVHGSRCFRAAERCRTAILRTPCSVFPA